MDKLQAVEETVSHLIRTVDELSDVIARQDAEIRRLSRQVGMLAERDADRASAEATIPLADQRPPHW